MSQEDLTVDISTYDFSPESAKNFAQNRWIKNQWPLVYFIEDPQTKIGYVGESTNASIRIHSHLNNPKRSNLKKISIIGSDKFNKSATLHIESNLIEYLSSEGTFQLQNANNGLSHHNYYQQKYYEAVFEKLWEELMKSKIVQKTIKQIQNTELFKYSPYKSLNDDQYRSVLEIIDALNNNATDQKDNHIFVKGSAGTGKTILAVYLIKLLITTPEELNTIDIEPEDLEEVRLLQNFYQKYGKPKIALVVAMTPLRTTLQKTFAKIPGLSAEMVISPSETFKKSYDILIVDEAHRLRRRQNISFMKVFDGANQKLGLGKEGTEIDWIVANSKHQIFFYDPAQSVKPSDAPPDKFDALLSKKSTRILELKSQMRVKGGADYISFVDDVLACKTGNSTRDIPMDYELKVFSSFREMNKAITNKNEEYELCRMVAGYSWPWSTKKKKNPSKYDIEIEGLQFSWNSTAKDWISAKNSFSEIGCIHTTQGYDLNYAAVIFGREISYDPVRNEIVINPKFYFDINGKKGVKDPKVLKQYIINIYKTLMYRGCRGTYVYACDKNLNDYLQKAVYLLRSSSAFRLLDRKFVEPYVNAVPLYDISVAAGEFSEPQLANEVKWVQLPPRFGARKGYFVCKVIGESMNEIIPAGTWCLFQRDEGGSREAKIVLAQHYKIQEPDFGSGFTIKRYQSKKVIDEEGWKHSSIVLKPQSSDKQYRAITLEEDEMSVLKVVGIFIDVIGQSDPEQPA